MSEQQFTVCGIRWFGGH